MFSLLRKLGFRFERWLNHRLKIGVFGLSENKIVVWRGFRTPDLIAVDEIDSWHIYPEMGFDIVTIDLKDGSSWRLFDKYNDLIGILKAVVGVRERSEFERN